MGSTNGSSALARESFGEMVKKGVFNPVRRFINADEDDRMQEALGLVFEIFEAKAKRGEKMDPALLVHAARLRAVDLSRHLARGTHSIKDPLEPRAFHTGRVELLHLDGLPDEDGDFTDEGDPALELGLLQHLSTDPEEKLNSALDLESWVASLGAKDVELLALRLMGNTIEETATAVGVSMTCAHHRLRTLGYELAARAGIVVVKKPRKPRTAKSATPVLDS